MKREHGWPKESLPEQELEREWEQAKLAFQLAEARYRSGSETLLSLLDAHSACAQTGCAARHDKSLVIDLHELVSLE
ncbi:hypothetical protein QWA_18417 [Alcaligenes faecalis subsp. faecalis NCIB 8687]|nr:hypothetical protein QWA_18417 [Alcaligenes faecalis subsp. faecalis NCIB 8687]